MDRFRNIVQCMEVLSSSDSSEEELEYVRAYNYKETKPKIRNYVTEVVQNYTEDQVCFWAFLDILCAIHL